MGECNPRQYCGKTRCDNEYLIQDMADQKHERLAQLNKKMLTLLDLIKKQEELSNMLIEALREAAMECEAEIITIEES